MSTETAVKKELFDREKAAVLLISLGVDSATNVYKHLREEEIEQLTLEISRMHKVSPEMRNEVLKDFYQMCMAKEYINEGGIDFARNLLEKSLGSESASKLLGKLTSTLQVKPFDFIKNSDIGQIMNIIQNENSQTIALILTYIEPAQAARILASLPTEKQVEIAERVALIDCTSPEYVQEVERVIEYRLLNMGGGSEYTAVDGIQTIVDIINSVDRGTEKNVLESLYLTNPELADDIKRRMFVFEDIVKLNNKHIQRVLKDVETSDITVALKGANADVVKKIFDNVSKRSREFIEEEMQYSGPVRIKDVEEAQQRIVNIIRALEETGEIVIARGGGDDLIV